MKGFTLMSNTVKKYNGVGAGIKSPTKLDNIHQQLMMNVAKLKTTPEVEAYEKAQNDLKEFRTYLQKDICVALGELDETQSHNNKSTYVYIKGKKQVSVEVSYVEPSPYYRRGAILFGDVKAEA